MNKKNVIIIFLCAVSMAVFTSAVSAAEINWTVENRFPVFNYKEDFQKLVKAFGTGSASDFLATNPSAARLRELLPITETAWNAKTGTYNAKTLFIKNHSVHFDLVGDTLAGECIWKFDSKEAKGPCREGAEFDVAADTPFTVEVSRDELPIATLKEPTGITTKLIIGLGDSFASGEGNPDHPTVLKDPKKLDNDWFQTKQVGEVIGKSAAWWDKTCHRSMLSWQTLYAIHQAITDTHRVVQYASFACSGAEIYNGFFNPQKDPPGSAGTKLKKSQHNALTELLCQSGIESGIVSTTTQTWHEVVKGPAKDQEFFGPVQLAQCSEKVNKVDEVLLSFGGNDFGFSGVVKWGIGVNDPNNHKSDLFSRVRKAGIEGFNEQIGIISPNAAAAALDKMDWLYSDLAVALLPFQKPSKKTFALIYPDPLPMDDFVDDLDGCHLRSRDGNVPLSLYAKKADYKLYWSNFKFGLAKEDAEGISKKFIEPLRKRQFKVISKTTWTTLDANDGFLLPGGNRRTICSNPPSCTTHQCDEANRLTWVTSARSSGIPHLDRLSKFSAYDPNRSRGLRYASDALLTQAGLTKKRKLDDDWKFGVAHPTAAVNAALADKLYTMTTTTR